MTTAIELAIKMLGEKQKTSFINEALTPAYERKVDKMTEPGHWYHQDEFILDHAAPGTLQKFQYDEKSGKKVIRIPVSLNQDNPSPSYTVKNFLEEKGYHIKDVASYRQGIVHKSTVTGNPEKGIPYKSKLVATKIGKVLEQHNAPDQVVHSYNHDPVRVGAGKKDYDLVITNHPHDVYGMSFDRGWDSCTNPESPKSRAAVPYLPAEINNHTHVAYLTDRGGDYNTNAIARLAFKHHTAITAKADSNPHLRHQTLIPESRVYGSAPTDFRDVAEKEMGKMFPIKNDIYIKNPNVYDDDKKTIHVPEGVKVSSEALDTAWKDFPKDSKHRLYQYVSHAGKYKSKKLREVQGALKNIMSEPTGNFQEDIGRIRESTYGLDDDQIRNGIGSNHNYDYHTMKEHIGKVMQGFDVHNPDHQMELRLFSYNHPLRNHVYSGLEKINPVRTVQDFDSANKKHKILGNRTHEAFPVDPNHELGHDPISTLAKAGVLHDVDDYHKAYFTFGESGGHNWYSMAHRVNEEKLPNGHHVLNYAVEELKKKDPSNYGDAMSLAMLYHKMPPNAKAFYSAQTGHNPDELMETHKGYINKVFGE